MGLSHVSAISRKWSVSGSVAIDKYNCGLSLIFKVFYGTLNELAIINDS